MKLWITYDSVTGTLNAVTENSQVEFFTKSAEEMNDWLSSNNFNQVEELVFENITIH